MIKQKRQINWNKIILSFLIACFLFSFGIFVGYLAKGIVSASIINIQDSTKNEILTLETINLIQEQNSCESYSLDLVSEKLDYLGELITILETKKGKKDPEVLEMKKLYSILEIRHYVLTREQNEYCAKNISTFMFFYSNDKDCNDEVEKKSFILSYLRKKYQTKVRVYAFDNDLDSDLIKVLKEKYKVERCSTIILNENKITTKIDNSEDLEKFLNISD